MADVIGVARLESWTGLSDEQVVREVLAGQTALFEILMRRHNQRLYRAARAIVLDAGEAEDVVQQAYVNAYTHLEQFDGRAQFATWLTRIAVHEAMSRAQRNGRYLTQSPDADDHVETIMARRSPPDPERQTFAVELAGLLESAIDGLSDGCREVFMLREIQGLSTTETAQCLGVSDDVVKTRLSRARASLRRDLLERAGLSSDNAFTFLGARCDRLVARVMQRIASIH
jgi:RNA polymerase sigma-70 factor, ECF subfamily